MDEIDKLLALPEPHARLKARRAQRKLEEETQAVLGLATAAAQELAERRTRPLPNLPNSVPSVTRAGTALSAASAPFEAKDGKEARIVLALDYGTTFTGVAYAWSVGEPIGADQIQVVQKWPGASTVKVPSQYSYSYSKNGKKNFGYDMDEDAKILSKTKLELCDSDKKDRAAKLKSLMEVLHGMISVELTDDAEIEGRVTDHLYKTTEDVIQDYLEKIAFVAMEEMEERLTKTAVLRTPVDMILTHPAIWSKTARNKTYRAAVAAFGRVFPRLRDVSFVSEPEACAHYTLHAAQLNDHARFQQGDCIVVADAGGGTVDLASFQITSIDSSKSKFGMKRIEKIAGGPYGATVVDEEFVKLLKKKLGPIDSDKIFNTGRFGNGGHFIWTKAGRGVYENFIPIKHDFDGTMGNRFTEMDLPQSLGIQDHPEEGIRNGKLRLAQKDLESVFKVPVEMIKAMVMAQANTLRRSPERYTVKSVFLSGGFAQSPYLFTQLSAAMGERGITVERGLECWGAVAKGAVMKGLGLLTEKPAPIVRCPCHFGIKTLQLYTPWTETDDKIETDVLGQQWTTEQVKWFVHKDDAIDPDGSSETYEYPCNWVMPADELEPPAKRVARESNSLFRRGRESAEKEKENAVDEKPREVVREITLVFYGDKKTHPSYKGLKEDALETYTLRFDVTKTPQTQRRRHEKDGRQYIRVHVVVRLWAEAKRFLAQVTSENVVILPKRAFNFHEFGFLNLGTTSGSGA